MAPEFALIQSARQGNVDAFNDLVLAYQDRIYNAAYRIMGDPASADDITQDAFITAFRKLEQFRGGSFGAWLTRIAVNLCYDELRRDKRHSADSLDDNEDFDIEADIRLTSDDPGPESSFHQAELTSAIERCFQALPAEFRIVAVMADVEEYSYEEIANITSISLGTVKSRISRARVRLRDCLQAYGELLPAKYRQEDNR